MFRKVCKYDLAAMSKPLVFIPAVWALAVAAALIIRLMNSEAMSQFFVFEMILVIVVFFCAAAVACFPLAVTFICLRRYYTHFFSDEGYLTFTLPVRRETLLWSKTLSSFLVSAVAYVAEAVAGVLFLLFTPGGAQNLREIPEAYGDVFSPENGVPLMILFFFYLVAALFGAYASAYFSVTQGHHLAKKHRVLAAVGIWYGISFVKRLLVNGFSLVFFFAMLRSDSLLFYNDGATYLFLFFMLSLEAGCFCLFYFWNRHHLKTRLALS